MLHHLPDDGRRYVLMYINDSCVVIGRNQSLFCEVNVQYLMRAGSRVCRRITGGGAVYHDRGNICFSFIEKVSHEKIGNYSYFNQPITDVLRNAGYDLVPDARNNLLAGGMKVSGSAQFTNRKNIISHGTLLYMTDLNNLRFTLRDNKFQVLTRAVRSVKSPVTNLSEINRQFDDAEAMMHYMLKNLPITDEYLLSDDVWIEIEQRASEFESAEWIYGRSPDTTLVADKTSVELHKGMIKHVIWYGKEYTDLRGEYFTYGDLVSLANTGNELAYALLEKFFTQSVA